MIIDVCGCVLHKKKSKREREKVREKLRDLFYHLMFYLDDPFLNKIF